MRKIIALCLLLISSIALAGSIKVTMYRVAKTEEGQRVGVIKFVDTPYGLLIEPHLQGLTPGLHGLHVHQNPSCDDFAKAAGGHYDPHHTKRHNGPYAVDGHLGDLPALFVSKHGRAWLSVLAPRLTTQDLAGRTIMIHAGADTYTDHPKPLGGGGHRVACGVVK